MPMRGAQLVRSARAWRGAHPVPTSRQQRRCPMWWIVGGYLLVLLILHFAFPPEND